MYYTGCDAHSTKSHMQHMDEDGALGLSMVVPTTPEGLSQFLDRLDSPTVVTLEASRGYWWLSEFFKKHPKVSEVHVVDPLRSRKIAQELSILSGYGRAKNDRIDSEMLAEQTRRGLAPAINVPTPEQLKMRCTNRHRMLLVQTKTRSANRIRAILSMHGYSSYAEELTNDFASKQKLFNQLPDYVKLMLDHFIEQSELLARQIQQCENMLDNILPISHPQIKLLMTAPGFGPVCSRIVYTEILDIKFFKAPKYLMSYTGLAPIQNESAGKKGAVRLNRHCNYYLKCFNCSSPSGATVS